MLRRGRPAPETRSADIRLWLGVHDSSRVEWTAGVPLPTTGTRRYQVELGVEIPANMFSPHETWEHLQIFTRLQSPSEEGAIEIERGDLEELRRDALGIAHRLKLLRNHVERAGDDAGLAVDDDVRAAESLVREVRRQLHAPGHLGNEIARECRLADELISHQLIELLAACGRALDRPRVALDDSGDASPLPTGDETARRHELVADTLDAELHYRRQNGWVTPRADDRGQLTAFLDRASRLKKHFQDVLFLDTSAYFVDTKSRNWTGVIAAAMAAVMWLTFTLLPIGQGARAGVGLVTFALAFAVAYAVKDRIKELGRAWLIGRLTRLYGQRVVTLRLPKHIDPAQREVAETHETFDLENDVLGVDHEASIGRPRRIVRLRFCMRVELHAAPPLQMLHIESLKHIFRYDLTPIFSRLDDAVKPVPVISVDEGERRVRFCDAPREYRFPARITFTDDTGVQARNVAIVVTKRGVERIEAA